MDLKYTTGQMSRLTIGSHLALPSNKNALGRSALSPMRKNVKKNTILTYSVMVIYTI